MTFEEAWQEIQKGNKVRRKYDAEWRTFYLKKSICTAAGWDYSLNYEDITADNWEIVE